MSRLFGRTGPRLASYTFSGVNDVITLTSTAALDVFAASFTMMMWVYPRALTASRGLFGKDNGGIGHAWSFDNVGSGALRFALSRGSGATSGTAESTRVLVPNAWQFVVVQFNGVTWAMYSGSLTDPASDMGLADNTPGTGTIDETTSSHLIGNVVGGGNSFPGSIASYCFANTILTLDELIEYQYTLKRPRGALVHCLLGTDPTVHVQNLGLVNNVRGTVTTALRTSDGPPLLIVPQSRLKRLASAPPPAGALAGTGGVGTWYRPFTWGSETEAVAPSSDVFGLYYYLRRKRTSETN